MSVYSIAKRAEVCAGDTELCVVIACEFSLVVASSILCTEDTGAKAVGDFGIRVAGLEPNIDKAVNSVTNVDLTLHTGTIRFRDARVRVGTAAAKGGKDRNE